MSNRKSCLELLDETFHWLRRMSAETWLIYSVCAAPFYLLALREFQELRTGPVETIKPGSLTVLAACYLLYGFGRSEFVRRFHREVQREPATTGGGFHAVVNHLLLHAGELALLPLALLSVVGFPWVLGFFRCALCKRETRLRVLVTDASQQCSRLYLESSLCSVIMLAVALAVFVNLLLAALIVPDIVKAVTGYETELTRNRSLVLNATTLAATLGLTGLLSETLLLGFYNLALFYRESQTSGRDLLLLLDEMGEDTAAW
jgi:hypothetical protein